MRTVLLLLGLTLLTAVSGQAQERAVDSVSVAGLIIPQGSPSGTPVRVDAGNSCVVDVTQKYALEGELEGSLVIDFRILVHGPCGSPPGTFDEEWIARGESSGTLRGEPYSTRLTYTARVEDGDIQGLVVFGPGLTGRVDVTGRFEERRLRYSGWVARRR
jgi:hypothetical protein